MYQTIAPLINLANHNLQAVSQTVFAGKPPDPGMLSDLWRSTMANQARFINEYTDGVLIELVRNRLLMAKQMEKLSAHAEYLTTQMAHAAVRAVAIAAQVRDARRDRRVLPLPLPGERRLAVQTDRRKSLNGDGRETLLQS